MWSFNLVRWLRSRFRSRAKTIEKKPRFRLCIEELETRLAPATFIWRGLGADNNWNTALNWQTSGGLPAVPTSSPSDLADLVFDVRGAARLTSNNNISGLLVNSIQIADLNNYNIGGTQQITLGNTSAPGSGTIQVAAGLTGENIALDINLAATAASQQFVTVNFGAELTLSGKLTGTTGSQLTKKGTGTLILTNDNSGFVGPFNLENDAGIVRISHNKALGAATNTVTVGNNSQLQIANVGPANPIANSLRLFGPGFSSDGSLYSIAGDNVWSGSIALGSNTLFNAGTGGVQSVTVTAGGTGYAAGGTPTVTFTGGGGSGATAVAIMDTHVIGANIVAGGSGYAAGTLTFGPPGTGATATYTVDGSGAINGVTITANGTGYDLANLPTVVINDPGGAGTGANLTAVLDRFVASVSVTNPGFGYTSAPGVSFSGGGGSGTTANATITAASTLTVTGVISDLGSPFNVTKIGQGTVVFANGNTYRGSTTVADGTLTIKHPLALGAVPSAGTSVVRNTLLGTIGTLRLEFDSAIAPNGPDDPTYWTLQDPTQAFHATNNPYIGFVVNSVPLTLNAGGFAGNGALWNFLGHNTWTGNVILGSPAPVGADVTINVADDGAGGQTRLFLTGVVQDVIAPNGPFNLTKIGQGDLVLSPTNQVTGIGTANLYRGTTDITAGTVTLRDSQGLGPQTKRNRAGNTLPIVTVQSGASLNLESNVGHIDSATGTINRLEVAAPISISGPGFNNTGALRSVSGINTYTVKHVTSPVQNAATGTAGGSLTNGTTYFYVITAIDGYGESLASNERSFTATATNQTATLNWDTVPGATGYRIYRTTTSGTYGATSLVTTINLGTTNTYNDTGTALTAGTPPAVFPIISFAGAGASIGVEPDPNQTASAAYFTNDYSLTINGGMSGTAAQKMTKVGTGHLILPNANNQFFGATDINEGWITIEDSSSLGGPNPSVQEIQPVVDVKDGAALMLKPFATGTSFAFTHNLVLQGSGIQHPFGLINFKGAVENLSGVNTLHGNIQLKGQVGIGVEEVFGRSHLTTTGTIFEGLAALNFTGNPSGGAQQNIGPGAGQNPVNTGSTSGSLFISAKVHSLGDDIRVYLGNWKVDPANARLIYDASNDFVSTVPTATNRFGADITINYTATSATIDVVDTFDPGPGPAGTGTGWLYEGLGPQAITYAPVAGPYATWITIVVNPGKTSGGITVWTYSAQIVPGGNFGAIAKLGSQRLDMQGNGVYKGGVDIREGVVRVENNTALGAPGNAGTIVQAGAALELAPTVPDQNGGQSIGAAIWGTPLTLNGTGNSTFGDAPLAVLGKDVYWHGPMTLNSQVTVTFQGAFANQAVNTLTSSNPLVTVATTTPGGGGLNAVQTFNFAGMANGDTFTLTFDDGVNPPATTTNITFNTNPNTLIANIRARLIALAAIGTNDIGVALASPIINIYPNSRLVVTGAIDDATNTTTNGTDLIMDGGGSLVLAGTNSYRGTTFVNQGILTLQSGQALGGTSVPGQAEIILTGARAGTTQFTLSFDGGPDSAPITYNGNASDVTNIGNALSAAFFTASGHTGGTATVLQTNPGIFLVTFGGTLANTTLKLSAEVSSGPGVAAVSIQGGTHVADTAQLQLEGGISVTGEPLIIQGTGHNFASALQTFTLGTTTLVPGGTFTLNFNGAASDTGPLAYNASAGQIQAALQNLTTVNNVGGTVLVSVDKVIAGTNEEQRVTFNGFSPGDTYQLYFDPASGAPQLGKNLTAPITFTGNPFTEKNNIVAALGNLQTIGGLSVGGTISGIAAAGFTGPSVFADFLFTGALADQDVPMVQAFTVTGTGAPVVSEFVKGATGYRTYTVGFQGSFDGLPQPDLTAVGTTGSTTLSTPVTTLAGGSTNATPLQWFSVGPAPITNAVVNGGTQPAGNQRTAGRVTGIDVQANFADDIYIATAGGGFWRSINGGMQWTPVFDSINSSVTFGGAVTIADTADSTVYFGTGEGNNSADSYYGSGVYVASTHADLATTVTRLLTNPDGSNPLAGKAINKIVVNPNNPLMIWVAVSDLATNGSTGNAGIWRYDGTNWLDLLAPGPNSNFAYSDVAIENNGATLRLYAALGNPTGSGNNDVRVSDNPAAATPTWNASTFAAAVGAGIGTIKIATVPGVFGTAYAAISNTAGNSMNVFRTTNGGTSWAATGANPPNYLAGQGNYDIAIAAKRVGGADLVFVGGHDTGAGTPFVFRSVNSGGAWTNVSKDANNVGPHTDIHALAIDANNNLVAGTDGGVWRFDNTAGTWADLNGNLAITQFNTVAVQPGNPSNILGGTQNNGTAQSTATQAWTQVDPTVAVGAVTLIRFVPGSPSIVFSIAGGTIHRSLNGGATWTDLGIAAADFDVDFLNPNRLVFAPNGGSVRESTNSGASSITLNSPNVRLVAPAAYQGVFIADEFFPAVVDQGANNYVPDTIYAASATQVFVTKNHGTTWASRSGVITGATNAGVSPIVITSANHGLATGNQVLITGVGGNTNANGTFIITVVDANSFSLNGSTGGPANYTTGGTWTYSNRTPPLVSGTTIHDLIVDPSDSNVLYLITSGRVTTQGTGRVFKSVNSGLTWTDVSAGLPLSAQTGSVMPAWKLVIDPRSNDLYLGTDEGVWKLTGGTGSWQRFGAGLPIVQVKDLDLNPTTNILTAATYGRGAWAFFLDDNTLANAPTNPGALRSIAGNNTWTGPITLAGATTISANGSQALQNGLSASTLNIFGAISDLVATNANTLTKIGGGDVILSGASTYAGVTDIQQGNLIIRNPNALGSPAIAGTQALSLFTTAAPVQKAPTLGTGGTIASGVTFYYQITAIGPQGESIGSNEQTITTTAANQRVNLFWTGVNGATGYKVYRSTSPGPFGSTSLLATIASAATVSYSDTGTAVSAGAPPTLAFTLTLGSATTAAINYTGNAATDAANIAAQLTGAFFTSAGFPGGTATVSATGTGLFLITLGGTLDGATQPMFTGAVTSGFGSASFTNGGGTVVEKGAALALESSLFLEPVTLNADGVQSYGGHNTGALRSVTNANTYTGNLTLNTNATIGVDSGSTLTINPASPITLTSANHGLQTGFAVTVAGVVGDTAANGTWTVTVVNANQFSLNSSVGNAPYISGGTWTLTRNITAASAATGAQDIRITSTAHGLVTGNMVTIAGALGNTAANGTFTITRIDADTFSLDGTAGGPSLAYTGGGLWLRARAISAADNNAPITVTSNGHGLANSDAIIISGAQGNTAINGPWTVASVTLNTFQLVGSNGTAAGSYTGGATFTRPAANGTITAANNPIGITDDARGFSLDKEGAGTLILASPDTYGSATAGTIVNQGILNIQNSNALGVAGATTTVRDGAQLQLQSAPAGPAVVVANQNLQISGSGISGTGALLNVSGNNTWGSGTSAITLTAVPGFAPTTTPAGTVSFGVAGADDNLTIGSTIAEPTAPGDLPTSGPLPMGLTKVGPGRLTLTQAGAYTGTTYVNTGVVRIQHSDALGPNTGNDIQRITMFDALGTGQFTLTFNGQTTGLLTYGLPATGGASPTASMQNALAALSAIGSTANVSVTRQTITLTTPTGVQTGFAYTVSFTGALAGLAQPLLVAAPSGGVKINASRVADGGIGTLVTNGASLELDGDPQGTAASISVPAGERLTLNGIGSNRTYAITAASQAGTTVTLTTASTAGLFTGETVNISGFTPAGYNGAVAITVIDATTFSYTAPAGLGAATVLGIASPRPGALHNVSGNNTWAGPVTLQSSSSIGVDPSTQLTVTGVVKDLTPNPIPSPIPPADLTKVGAGTLVFPNANTYTGNTFIDAGTLNIRNNTALGVNTSSVQSVSISGTSGTFQLAFAGEFTGNLPFGVPASGGVGPTASVQNALNALTTINTGGGSVIVTQLGNTYTVFFNGGPLAATAQPLLAGVGSGGTSVTVAPLQLGAESVNIVAAGAALQLQGGIAESSAKALLINGAGPAGGGALHNVAGSNSIAVTTPVILQSDAAIGADAASLLTLPQTVTDEHQVQTVNFTGFTAGTTYTLAIAGDTTGVLTFSNSATTNATTIRNALNALPTLVLQGGTVTVVNTGGANYAVTFGGRMIGRAWPSIVRTRLSSGATSNASGTMVSDGRAVDKVGAGTVQYTGTTANTYTGLTHVIDGVLQLNKPAATNAIAGDLTVGSTGIAEVQTLTITGTAGTFGLAFNGQTTGDLAFDVPASGGTGATASVQNALMALPTIGGVGGTATVTKTGNVYTITFGGNLLGANLPALVMTGTVNVGVATVVDGSATANEQQAVTVTGTSGTFTLTVDNGTTSSTTVPLAYNIPASGGALPADSVQDALNALTSVAGVGGFVSVSKLGNVFTVVFQGGLGNTNLAPMNFAITPIGSIATVTDGGLAAGNAVAQLLQPNQIDNSSDVLVNGNGLLNLNGNNEDLDRTLTIVDGQVTTGAATLLLNNANALNMTGGTINDASGVVDLRGNVTATSTFTGPATITGTGTLDLHGATRTFAVADGPNASDLRVNSVIADTLGSSGLVKAGTGRLELDATNTYGGVTRIDVGDVQVDGVINNVSLNGGSLSGLGTVGTVTMASTGTVNPGDNGTANPIGGLTSGAVTWNANTTFFIDLAHTSVGAPVAGVDNDILTVNGNVVLGNGAGSGAQNALLMGAPQPGIQVGDQFTILQTTGSLTGLFDGIIGATRAPIPHGGTVYLNGQKFIVTYDFVSAVKTVVLTRQLAVFTNFTIVADYNASVYGQEVTYTVTATPEAGASLATSAPLITFTLDSGFYTHPVFLNASGVATYSPQSQHGIVWAPGVNHTISAVFTDANNVFQSNVTPTGNPITQVVNKNTVTVVASSNPAVSGTVPVYGQGIDVIATVTPVVTPNVPGASNPTNNVRFDVDANAPQYLPINPYVPPPASETATLNLPGSLLLGAGAHAVAISYAGTPAAYTGDANYAASAAPVMFNYTVKADQSVIAFTPAPVPSNLGQTASFNLQVTPALAGSTGQPVGTIDIYDAPTATGTPLNASPIAYSGGTITFNINTLLLGAHTITAKFTPSNTNYLASTASIPFTVNPATTATSISTSYTPAAPTYGQSVTFNMQVVPNPAINPSFGLPTGTITLWDGPENTGINLGTGSVNTGNGQASVTTTPFALSQGNHTLTAVYNGDGQFGKSTGTLAVFIAGVSANTSVTASPNPGDYNLPLTLTATVSATIGTPPTGAGTYAIFWDGAVGAATGTTATFVVPSIGNSVAVNVGSTAGFANGQSVLITDGAHTIRATVTVNSGTNMTVQTTAILLGSAGDTMALRAALANATTASPLGASVMATGGTAALNLPAGALTAGNHTIRASYLDLVDTNYVNGTNSPLNLAINNAPTTTVVNSPTWSNSPTSPVTGQPVTLHATVTSPGGPVTIGAGSTVTFWDGPVGTGTIIGTGNIVDAAGNASFTTTNTSLLSATTHTINAAYADTANLFFKPSNTSLGGSYGGFVVNKANTTVNPFTSSSTSTGPGAYVSSIGQAVTFTATVVSNAPSTAPVTSATAAGATVTFFDNSVQIGSPVAINASGVATLTTSTLTIGTHTITARYNGSGNFNVSPDASLTQVVRKAANVNVSALTVGNNYATALTYNGTVVANPTTSGTPTGTVSVYEGATLLATSGAITAGGTGIANFSLTIPIAANLSVGSHSLRFEYSGDTSPAPGFAPTSTTITQIINKAVTTTAIDSDSPIVSGFRQAFYGQTITFTAVVTAQSGGTPDTATGTYANGSTPATGGVIFRDNGFTITGTVTVTGTTATTATYTLSTNALVLGTHTISATYAPPTTTNFAASSSTMTQKIVQATTTTTIISSSPVLAGGSPTTYESDFGQAVTFTATVTSVSGGTPAFGPTSYNNRTTSGVPLNFYIANPTQWSGFLPVLGTVTRTGTTANSATYTITTSLLGASAQNYQVQAYYLGNANFAPTPTPQITAQTSAVLYQKVNQALTNTVVNATTPAFFGQSVALTATVTAASGGTPATANGYMKFFVNGTPVGLGTLLSTTATTATWRFITNNLSVNTAPGHAIQAQYVTDSPNFAWSGMSPVVNQIVNPAQTQTVLTSSPTQWASDVATTFVADVSYAQGFGGSLVNGGSVTFKDGAATLAVVNAPSGIFATFIRYAFTTTTPLSNGSHTITAIYANSVNTNVAGSQDSKTQTVAKFSDMTLIASAASAPAGTTVTYLAALMALGGAPIANAPVNFTINGTVIPATTNASGQASVSYPFNTAGTYTITATFPGDGVYNPVTRSVTTVIQTGRLA